MIPCNTVSGEDNAVGRYVLLMGGQRAVIPCNTVSGGDNAVGRYVLLMGGQRAVIPCNTVSGEDSKRACLSLAVSQSASSPTAAMFLSSWLTPPLSLTLAVSTAHAQLLHSSRTTYTQLTHSLYTADTRLIHSLYTYTAHTQPVHT